MTAKFSWQKKLSKCIKCNIRIDKSTGQVKLLSTESELSTVAQVLNQDVVIGSILCNKCRRIVYAKRQKIEANSEPQQLSQSSLIPSSSQGSTVSSLDDPSFVATGNVSEKPDESFVEMLFPRVISTHKYCFLCGATKNIVTVPCEARRQVLAKKKIFIPNGNRCCAGHLIMKCFFEEALLYLRIYSHTSLIEVRDLQNFL